MIEDRQWDSKRDMVCSRCGEKILLPWDRARPGYEGHRKTCDPPLQSLELQCGICSRFEHSPEDLARHVAFVHGGLG
jgi:hypothetical protein